MTVRKHRGYLPYEEHIFTSEMSLALVFYIQLLLLWNIYRMTPTFKQLCVFKTSWCGMLLYVCARWMVANKTPLSLFQRATRATYADVVTGISTPSAITAKSTWGWPPARSVGRSPIVWRICASTCRWSIRWPPNRSALVCQEERNSTDSRLVSVFNVQMGTCFSSSAGVCLRSVFFAH